MTALIIIIAILLFIALLRFGVTAEYGAEGLAVAARVGFFVLRVFPRPEKKKREKPAKKKKKKEKKPKKAKEPGEVKAKPGREKPGKLETLTAILRAVKKTLGRLRRRLLIKNITVHMVAAGGDPYKTAMTFGTANLAFAAVMPLIESCFRVKRRDLRASYDFESADGGIYVKAAISIAVWEVFYIVFAILPALFAIIGSSKGKTTGKEGHKYGKAADKRAVGNDDAKGQGDG